MFVMNYIIYYQRYNRLFIAMRNEILETKQKTEFCFKNRIKRIGLLKMNNFI